MTVKQDEIELVQTILKYCKEPYDMLPTEQISNLSIHPKRINYLLLKMTHFINYGVNVWYGWIEQDSEYIKNYYKNTHGVIL